MKLLGNSEQTPQLPLQCQAKPARLEKWKADLKSIRVYPENCVKQVWLVYAE